MQKVEALAKPNLGVRSGADLHVCVADSGHPDRWRQFLWRDLVLHFHDMAGHVHLGESGGQSGAEESQGKGAEHMWKCHADPNPFGSVQEIYTVKFKVH